MNSLPNDFEQSNFATTKNEIKNYRKELSYFKDYFSDEEIQQIIKRSNEAIPILDNNFLAIKFWSSPVSKLTDRETTLAWDIAHEAICLFREMQEAYPEAMAKEANYPNDYHERLMELAAIRHFEYAIKIEPNLIRQLKLGIYWAKVNPTNSVADNSEVELSIQDYHAYDKHYQTRIIFYWNNGHPEATIREFNYFRIKNANHQLMLSKVKHLKKMCKRAGVKKIYFEKAEKSLLGWLRWWKNYTFELEMMNIQVGSRWCD